MYWYIGSLHTLSNIYTTALTRKYVARKALFAPCLIEHIPLSQIKITCAKKNGRRKQVRKENGYKESITSKTLRDSLTIRAFLSHSI